MFDSDREEYLWKSFEGMTCSVINFGILQNEYFRNCYISRYAVMLLWTVLIQFESNRLNCLTGISTSIIVCIVNQLLTSQVKLFAVIVVMLNVIINDYNLFAHIIYDSLRMQTKKLLRIKCSWHKRTVYTCCAQLLKIKNKVFRVINVQLMCFWDDIIPFCHLFALIVGQMLYKSKIFIIIITELSHLKCNALSIIWGSSQGDINHTNKLIFINV